MTDLGDRRYAESAAWLARARAVTPGGAQTLSRQACRFPGGAFPAILESGRGGYLVRDVDGHEYIDWIAGLAAVTLGYDDPGVRAAIEPYLGAPTLSLPHRLEAEVAEVLTSGLIPCAAGGLVRFVKTGSEATEAAVRIARCATGRPVVLSCGYHGWHTPWMARKPVRPGVPDAFQALLREFRYNDLASLDAGLGADVAAIILEPALLEAPAAGFLEGVRARATRIGAVLIFDEIVTGFRWALAGGQEYFGVTPDLACFGKGLANGWPLACVLGRRELMAHGDVVSGTFGGEVVALAAAKAVLERYAREPVIAGLWQIGRWLQDGFNVFAAHRAVPMHMLGYPVHPKIIAEASVDDPQGVLSLFYQETAVRGVLFHPAGNNVMYAHDIEAVTQTLAACEGALLECRAALQADDVRRRLRGELYQETSALRAVPGDG